MTDLRKLLAVATPGPWIFYADLPSVDPNWHIVTTKNKARGLANVHIESDNMTDMANARLIAMAPDLAAALLKAEEALGKVIDCDHHNHYDGPEPRSVNIARAALSEIHKLTGEA